MALDLASMSAKYLASHVGRTYTDSYSYPEETCFVYLGTPLGCLPTQLSEMCVMFFPHSLNKRASASKTSKFRLGVV